MTKALFMICVKNSIEKGMMGPHHRNMGGGGGLNSAPSALPSYNYVTVLYYTYSYTAKTKLLCLFPEIHYRKYLSK